MFKFGPSLAESYLFISMGVEIERLSEVMKLEMEKGKFKTLDLLHHLTSGLKSLYSQMTYEGIDMIR
jgi:hypothetical protein